MSMLDDLFGKQEIGRLRAELLKKSEEVTHLKIEVSRLFEGKNTLQRDLIEAQKEASKSAATLASAQQRLDQVAKGKDQLTSDFESFRQASISQTTQTSKAIADLQRSLAGVTADLLTAKQSLVNKEQEVKDSRLNYDQVERGYQEREKKLAEKSERLLQERQKFQQQSIDLQSREQRWKQIIEPKILVYEQHLKIDAREKQLDDRQKELGEIAKVLQEREADMVRRQCLDDALTARQAEIAEWDQLLTERQAELNAKAVELSQMQSELIERTTRLDKLEQELAAFRGRVLQLDADTLKINAYAAKLEIKEKERQEGHLQRLAELRQQRSVIRQQDKELAVRGKDISFRETDLKTRLTNIKRDENKIVLVREENAALKNKELELNGQIRELESHKRRLAALAKERENLLGEHQELKEKYAVAVNTVTNSSQEIALLKSDMKRLSKVASASVDFKSSLTHPKVLSWLLQRCSPKIAGIKNGWLGYTGFGPWKEDLFDDTLQDLSFEFWRMPDDDLEHLIVGRKDWDKDDLLAQIDARDGIPLRIYSQEMFFSKLLTGRDPFDANDPELLQAFAEDHPALQYLMSLEKSWPTVTDTDSEKITVVRPEDFGVKKSPLHLFGYHVGAKSRLTAMQRQKKLTDFLEIEARRLKFSDDSTDDYKAKWGRGGGAQRLYRMAEHITRLLNTLGQNPLIPQASTEWYEDLKWLRKTYYPKYKAKFSWPQSN